MSSRRIGNYQITDYIGSGGFGTVFKAEDVNTPGRIVAIKELHKKHTRNAVIKQRFFQEAVAMARLDHPNLPRLFTFGEDNGSYYLVMEFLSGRLLNDDLQKDGPLPTASAVEIMMQVLDALSYAHRNGIIHRDLKPDNIMLLNADSLRVKVLDFGIARMVGGESLTLAGEGFGTPAYMSPERLSGLASDDPRIDIYSAGIILFEMLAGKVPFNSVASDPVIYWSEMRKQHESEPLPALSERGISPDIDRVIARATAKRIEDRYASADEMLAELKSINSPVASAVVDRQVGLGTARLLLTTAPAAAEVYVDDSARGMSDPVRGRILIDNLMPGTHSVRVSKGGYGDYRINVVLEDGGQTDLQVALPARATVAMPQAGNTAANELDTARLDTGEENTALLLVESLPAGATLSIGSRQVAQADEDGRATVKLPPGQHEIEAKAPTGETTRRVIKITEEPIGAPQMIAIPIETTAETPSSQSTAAGRSAQSAKGKQMAAVLVVMLLLALAAVAYVVTRGPAHGNAQPDDGSQTPQPGAGLGNTSQANQNSPGSGQAGVGPVADEKKKPESGQSNDNKNSEKPKSEGESNNPAPVPSPPSAPPAEPVKQEACLGVRVIGPGGNIVRRARVMFVEQPDTSSESSHNPDQSPNGLWYKCGLVAGHNVRVVIMGMRGGGKGPFRTVRNITLTPGRNTLDVQLGELLDEEQKSESPIIPGRRRPRLQRP